GLLRVRGRAQGAGPQSAGRDAERPRRTARRDQSRRRRGRGRAGARFGPPAARHRQHQFDLGVPVGQRNLGLHDEQGGDRSTMKPPDEVANVVLQALSEAKPKRRYMIVPEQSQAEETIRGVVDVLVQLNEDQAYSYDRAALIRMVNNAA